MVLPASRAVIIGDRRVDKTGHMYENALAHRDVGADWVDLHTLMRSIADVDIQGATLLDAAELSPTVVRVVPSRYGMNVGAFGITPGTLVFIVNNDFDAYAWVITDVLHRLGAVQMNSARSLRVANNKWMSHVMFRDAGLPVAEAALVREPDQLESAGVVLGFPIVVKELESARGTGVRLAHDVNELRACGEDLELHRQPLMVEHYIECGAVDKRILNVNGDVVAAMKRRACPGDFRANIALGGSGEKTHVSEFEERLVQKATASLGLRVVGMDVGVVEKVLPEREYLTLDSSFLFEANPMPGMAGLREATNIDCSHGVIDAMLTDAAATVSAIAQRPVSKRPVIQQT